ncbi:MAG: hypothetical protein IT379_21065 [Deltaproteobacteria bacterium]|nr:hypothetical protein [Deltaproteobacteria bacterium]
MSDDVDEATHPKGEDLPGSDAASASPIANEEAAGDSRSGAEAAADASAESRADEATPESGSEAEAETSPKAPAETKGPAPASTLPRARSPWITRVGLLVAGLAVGGLAAWWFFVREPTLEVPRDLLAAVPARADMVARLDLGRLRRSRHLSDLLAEGDRRSGKLSKIRERCGFDPIEKVEELVLLATLDGRGRTEDFAYIARGDLSRARSEACAEAVAGGEGGALRIERYEGRLVLAAERGDGRIALLNETHAVGGGRALVHGVIDVLVKGAPSLAGSAPLSSVVRRISDGQDFAAALALSGPTQRSLEGSLPAALAPLARARSFGVSAALTDGRWRVGAVAQMPSPNGASSAVEAVDGQLASLRRSPLIGLTVLGTVLGGVRVAAEGNEAIATGSASEDQIDEMVSLWQRFGRRRSGGRSPIPPGLLPGGGDDAPGRPPDAPGPLGRDERARPPADEPPSPGVHSGARPERTEPGTTDPGSP